MYDYIVTKPPLDEETLAHYGVLGMKWGVKKDPDKAWDKANKELTKRKKKANVTLQKSIIKNTKKAAKIDKKLAKVSSKYLKSLSSYKKKDNHQKVTDLFLEKERLSALSAKANADKSKAIGKAARAQKRSSKWEEQMRKAFGATKYSKAFSYTTKERAKYDAIREKRENPELYKLRKKANRIDFGDNSLDTQIAKYVIEKHDKKKKRG